MTMEMETRNETAPAAVEREENRKRGFTLTEIAIVLGIIGLILGAIWVAAAAVYTNMRVARCSQELLQITQAVRSLYATATVTGAGVGDLTPSLIPAGVFPTDSLPAGASSTVVNAPWNGGTIQVLSVNGMGTAGDSFSVLFESIPPQGCINLLVSSTGAGRDPGMISAGGLNTNSASNLTALPTWTSSVNFANATNASAGFPASTAATACGTGVGSTVGFTFRLRV